ncbi:MAG: methionine synthase [Chloroflexi bacterium]|nr:methionine synthase [Chloroflexota bacterium]
MFEPLCLATAVGSMPQASPEAASQMVLRFLPDIPAWPQLPARSFKENMYVQYSEGFPGFIVEDDRFYIDPPAATDKSLERLYQAYVDNRPDAWKISEGYAAGLYALLREIKAAATAPTAVKGQVTGPVSWGLTVTDQQKRPVLYDDALGDALAKHLRLKAAWQLAFLRPAARQHIITLDEPFMSAYGSAYISLTREKVISLLEEVLGGLRGCLKGIHCCANTDWSVLLATSVNIVNPDVYNYATSFNLYPEEIKKFLDRDGIVAWGIVPNDEASLKKESVASLRDRLDDVIAPLARKGIPFRKLLARSLVTPSCGLSSLGLDACELALETLAGLSRELRGKYLSAHRTP